MEKMIDLKDLLKHEILDLYSAEEQIIEAMPAMIEKANDSKLKKALQEHLKITEKQKTRLDKVKSLLGETEQSDSDGKGFFSSLFGGSNGTKCKGTEGLITEGKKMMGEKMTPEVLDAAIIASAQKIEHYEICGYGTARAFARELNLGEVAKLLEETLNEEYQADDLLTEMAVGRLNQEAQDAKEGGQGNDNRNGNNRRGSNGQSSRSSASKGGKKAGASNKSVSKSTGKSSGNTSKPRGTRTSGKSSSGKNKKATSSRGR
ncbi:MAG TPA: ferritin-like domain-containing protein [Flavitalea sp.]|nr:ferritin-like domain-containing protein [Flavitalea sp.]